MAFSLAALMEALRISSVTAENSPKVFLLHHQGLHRFCAHNPLIVAACDLGIDLAYLTVPGKDPVLEVPGAARQ